MNNAKSLMLNLTEYRNILQKHLYTYLLLLEIANQLRIIIQHVQLWFRHLVN